MIDDFIRIHFFVVNDVNINININVYHDFCLFYQIVLLGNQNTKPNQRFHVLLQSMIEQHKCCGAEKIQKQKE